MQSNKKISGYENKNEPFSQTLTKKLVAAGFGVFCTHPIRACMARASVEKKLSDAIKNTAYFHDFHINFIRGTTSTGFQLITKHWANEYFGHETFTGKLFGLIGPVLAGVGVASTAEVYFIRKNTTRNSIFANTCMKRPPLFRYNNILPMLYLFGAREIAFCYSVFNDGTLYEKLFTFLIAALITAPTQKLVSIHITDDILGLSGKVPDYKMGFCAEFKNIAYGRYHNSGSYSPFNVLITNPKTIPELTINLASVLFDKNVVILRGLYLATLFYSLKFSTPKINQWFENNKINENDETLRIRKKL